MTGTTPCLTIDLDRIEHNARVITTLCADHGISVSGATKCTCGHPDVARAMLRGGVHGIADSRLENIQRMREAGVEAPFMLLRLPALSGAQQVVESADVSLNSELSALAALSAAATGENRVHDVILMVDLGDLREGLRPEDLLPTVRQALKLPGIHLRGLGTNLGCFSGVMPNGENMRRLAALADQIQATCGFELELLSGMNSSGLELLAEGSMPAQVNHARIGEAILLGRETTHRRPWPGTFQDAFTLHAEVLELKRKPSLPVGERGEDAFGELPAFEDRGTVLRALVNVGREDVEVSGLTPLDGRLEILGASSDYLALDVSAAEGEMKTGDAVAFSLNYSALLAAMTSQYVKKQALLGGAPV